MMYLRSKVQLRSTLFLLFCVGFISTSACSKNESQTETHIVPKSSDTQAQDEIKKIASALNVKAFDEETKVTTLLKEVADSHQASLQGLEHRLKTKSSTLRKLKKLHKDAPEVPVAKLKISDTLRYTLEVSDEPEGHYVKTIQDVLKALEGKNYQVVKVKNYWPKGDNYSGVNTIISTQDGFQWELQFHTPASYQEAKSSHDKYESLRANDTPVAEKQKLFTEMAKPWESIAVPKDVLEPHNLHQKEEIKKWNAPK